MYIKKLYIINYRNIAEAEFDFSPGFNCLIGENGAGKTNVLDAIYHLSMCRSSINPHDACNIAHNASFFVLEGDYADGDRKFHIYGGMKRGEKKIFKRDDKAYVRFSEHIGRVPTVLIAPDDIHIVDGAGEVRRKMLDGIISQHDRVYLENLMNYNRLLIQRNALLKKFQPPASLSLLDVLDVQLAAYGATVMKTRRHFIEEYRGLVLHYFKFLSGGHEKTDIFYTPSSEEDNLYDSFVRTRKKDIVLGYTSSGVHRDDISMIQDGYPVRKSASQGQKKTLVIALKLAQYIWLKKNAKTEPLLLLDDIFAKLDEERSKALVEMVGGEDFGQVVVADTNFRFFENSRSFDMSGCKIFKLKNGALE